MTRIIAAWTGDSESTLTADPLGNPFTSDVAITVSGVWWQKSTSGGAPTTMNMSIWRESDQSRLATTGSVDVSGAASNAWHKLDIGPVDLDADTAYVVSAAWTGACQYDNDMNTAGITSDDGHITIPAGAAIFGFGGEGDVYPPHSGSFNGLWPLDIEYDLTSGTDHAVSGTIAATSAASLAITANRRVAGTIAASSAASLAITARRRASGIVAAHSAAALVVTADRPVSGTIAARSAASLSLIGSATVYVKRDGSPVLVTGLAGAVRRDGVIVPFGT